MLLVEYDPLYIYLLTIKIFTAECVEAIDSDMADVMTMKSNVLYENRNKLKPILTTQTVASMFSCIVLTKKFYVWKQ